MSKIFLNLTLLLFLSNCAAPGSAFITPFITGVKTKSVQQASLSLASSLSSNHLFKRHEKNNKKTKNKMLNNKNHVVSSLHVN
tara:strand:+ start:481 stop:729 length:249 start_codon:yes stop_codon:yes gene_type:complete